VLTGGNTYYKMNPIEITTQRANYLINRMLALSLFDRGSNSGSLLLSIIKN